ncbi:maleylpyruvate isomerase N-terminal domain-containing protein [Streptomyces lavenduligriseus]|uniref:maleylpyruvate isomerase family mycothiol-dependent enzyme n=1 Tax=Streptomyces eurythermus TaxID=42237 RepID=UPI00279C027B|nr:maleylpyruvate isomerase N-terminal domain-containing protein [Streptomyces lavenduligriseus]
MRVADFLEVLDHEGRLLAAAAAAAGPGADVPPCPGWRVRDLVRHLGAVHRWAAALVADRATTPPPLGDPPERADDELVNWYRDSHRLVLDTLAAAPADLECWTFHAEPNPSPPAFRARRQAHETAVHRYDAESARGGEPSPVGREFAVDGIDEPLRGFHARERSRLRSEQPRVLRVRAVDAGPDAVWTVRLTAGPAMTVRAAEGEAEAELSGPAEQWYLALWNRTAIPRVTGDPALAALWRERSGI